MPGDLIRFVDSIDASPTVRLDLNDHAHFWVRKFDAPPPRLRRAMSSNAMRDGISVGSAAYDGRTLVIDLETIHANQDLSAIQLQKLWRELDRPTNILMYQPDGLTKPVFFRTFRSDASQLEDVMAQAAMRRFTIEVLAEPHALGLKETLGPYAISNNPAAASNPTYFDVTGALGDVPAPLVWWDQVATLSSPHRRLVAAQHRETSGDLEFPWFQGEDGTITLGTDTSNPGGGPDATMSGTGANNFVRTTFATNSAMATRLTKTSGLGLTGRWRVLVALKSSAAGSIRAVYTPPGGGTSVTGASVATPATGQRMVADLGVFSFTETSFLSPGYSATPNAAPGATLALQASRTGGSGTTDWDAVMLVPAGGQRETTTTGSSAIGSSVTTLGFLFDAVLDRVGGINGGGDPTAGAATVRDEGQVVGGLPYIAPGAAVANRYHVFPMKADGESPIAATTTVHLAYWPRYKFVRPVSS